MKRLHTSKLMLPLVIQLGITCTAGMLPVPAAASIFYNGSSCVPFRSAPVVYENGMIINPNASGAPIAVECPISKDTFGGLEAIYVQVIDNHPSQAVRCNVYTVGTRPEHNDNGGLFISASTPPLQTIVSPRGVRGAGSGVRTYISCSIPARSGGGAASGIVSYTAMPPTTPL